MPPQEFHKAHLKKNALLLPHRKTQGLKIVHFSDLHYKKIIKTTASDGEAYKYTEHSSEFWPYKLVQIVSKLPSTYKKDFLTRYRISEEKLTTVLDALDKVNNQKLYKYLRLTLEELRATYAAI